METHPSVPTRCSCFLGWVTAAATAAGPVAACATDAPPIIRPPTRTLPATPAEPVRNDRRDRPGKLLLSVTVSSGWREGLVVRETAQLGHVSPPLQRAGDTGPHYGNWSEPASYPLPAGRPGVGRAWIPSM